MTGPSGLSSSGGAFLLVESEGISSRGQPWREAFRGAPSGRRACSMSPDTVDLLSLLANHSSYDA
eukprot:scaffold23924_cov74-Phaeocystis_antarctica.AAC.3